MAAKNEKIILWGMILAYIAFFGVFTSLRHYNFQTQTWDLAPFVQSLWNTLHGKIMHNNLEEAKNTLGVHMSPVLFLLVPGYALFPTPYFLLITQTIALGLGAWPLYLLALKILNRKNLALTIAAGYLLYPSLHWINTFDFHPVTFMVPALIAAFYFLETKQWLWFSIFSVLAAGSREDSVLAVIFTGIFIFLRALKNKDLKEMKIGATTAILFALYFILSTKIMMPALGGGLLRIDRYAHLGQTPAEIIGNIPKTIFNFQKFNYLFWLFLPAAFLPFFSGAAFILLIPGLLENLLTDYGFQFSSLYQYDSVLIAGIFISAIFGLKAILEKWPAKDRILNWLFIIAIIAGYITRSPVNPISFPAKLFKSNPHWEALRKMVEIVPENPNLSVAAQTNLVPHLSNREHAYVLGKEPFPADIVLIDGADPFGFKNEEEFENYANTYLYSGNYEVRQLDNRYLILFKKGL